MNIINYLDERWVVELCANIQDNSKELKCFLELAEAVKKSCGRSSLSLTSNIWIIKCGHDNLCDILYGPLTQDPDLRDYLLRLARIIDETDSYEIDKPENHAYNSEAHAALHYNKTGGLLYKENEELPWWDDSSMILIDCQDKILSLFRKLPIYHNMGLDEFDSYLEKCFPNIYFLDDARDFSKTDISEKNDTKLSVIIKHLSYLNDHAQYDYLIDPEQFEQKALSHGVELSRESSSTKRNQDAVKERTKKINEEALFFELHTKLSREKGRIHFHIGSSLSEKINKLSEGHLIVGIVCKHLST
ncbi:hypothetical protein [Klebsiella sp. 141240]|uniref:hypothetical protein n=1 Tax=Klebsiella sp. 141240 TaxID=3020034 RepID=UPI002295E5E5|nr:hypothetical protein [Klebsiella aerogenes]HCU2334342.1 hypothetical protein [Klebsiella aerogenes]